MADDTLLEMGQDTFLYFAFGSNLLRERILMNNPSAVFVAPAILQDHRLGFSNATGERWKCGGATIIPSQGDNVWGVVWLMNNADMESLDRQEGVGLYGVGHYYDTIQITVHDDSGKSYICRSYMLKTIKEGKIPDGVPSPQYKDIIIHGAVQAGLQSEYVNELRSITDNGYAGRLEIYEKIKSMLSVS